MRIKITIIITMALISICSIFGYPKFIVDSCKNVFESNHGKLETLEYGNIILFYKSGTIELVEPEVIQETEMTRYATLALYSIDKKKFEIRWQKGLSGGFEKFERVAVYEVSSGRYILEGLVMCFPGDTSVIIIYKMIDDIKKHEYVDGKYDSFGKKYLFEKH